MSCPSLQSSTSQTPISPAQPPGEELTLLTRLLADDGSAWREFNALYSRHIYRCITRVTARFVAVINQDDIREIYAMLCLQLLANDKAKLRSFDATRGNRLTSWLGLLASHCAYDFLRSRRREPRFEEVTDTIAVSNPAADPFAVCSLREQAQVARELLGKFSRRDQLFMALYYGEGLAPERIARQLNISIKTVYSKKHKIRSRLEALLGRSSLAA